MDTSLKKLVEFVILASLRFRLWDGTNHISSTLYVLTNNSCIEMSVCFFVCLFADQIRCTAIHRDIVNELEQQAWIHRVRQKSGSTDSSNTTNLKKITGRFLSKFAVKSIINIPSHLWVKKIKSVNIWQSYNQELARLVQFLRFYRAMLCIRGTSHGPVSVRPSVRHKSEFY